MWAFSEVKAFASFSVKVLLAPAVLLSANILISSSGHMPVKVYSPALFPRKKTALSYHHLFWVIPVIQEMIADHTPDSLYTFLEKPPSHIYQEFLHPCVKRYQDVSRKQIK